MPRANAQLLVALVVHNGMGVWGRAVVKEAREPVQCKVKVIAHKAPGLDMNVAPVWALGLVALGAMGLQPESPALWGGEPLGDAPNNVAGRVQPRGSGVSGQVAASTALVSIKGPGITRREVGLAINGALVKEGLNVMDQAIPPGGLM